MKHTDMTREELVNMNRDLIRLVVGIMTEQNVASVEIGRDTLDRLARKTDAELAVRIEQTENQKIRVSARMGL